MSTALSTTAQAQSIQVAAESYILIDADTGTVLAENNADMRLPPASLTKIMSSYLYFQAIKDGVLDLDQEVTISKNAWGSNVAGSKMFIEVGKQVRVEDLLRGVIIQSGNDASIALAEAIAGDEKIFAAEMNRTAEEMGLSNTQFQTATGLPRKSQYTSARDISTIVRYMVRDFPDLYKLYSEQEFTYNNIRQPNRNRLLSKFAGADGVKTGYTKAAGYCLVSSAVRDGRRLISVLMKTKSPRVRESESIKLLTYGFNNFHTVRLFSQDDTRTLPVWGGESEEVAIRPAQSAEYVLPRRDTAEYTYTPYTPLQAPIAAGDVVGELQVNINEETHETIEVVAVEDVPEGSWLKQIQDKAKVEWFGHGSNNAVLSQW